MCGVLLFATTSMAQEAPPAEEGSAAEGSAAPTEPAPPEPAPPPPPPPVVQPAPPVEPTPVVEAGYPQAYGARPLALPARAFEGAATLTYARSELIDIWTLSALVRYSLGQIELDAGVGIFLADDADLPPGTTIDRERLTNVLVGARYAIDPNFMAGASLVVSTPTDDAQTYTPQLALMNRRHLAPGSSLDLIGSAGISHFTGFDEMMLGIPSSTSLVLGGEARMIAQAAPTFALEGSARLGIVRSFEEPNMFMPQETAITYSYGVRAIVSASAALDIALGLDIYNAESETLSLAIIGRSVP